ncbi:glycosyltransferase family 87 protein, partial [Gemmata sp. JC717]|uniref:glycosyltransferase family 87 protein n=1 Tax=Gemmata algarum TaxID=2975278 RepID=UPI0021BB0812
TSTRIAYWNRSLMPPKLRTLLVVLVGGAAVAAVADRIVSTPGMLSPRDFIEYWAAGRVNLRGGNPYDPRLVLAEQQAVEPHRDGALMMWNPPPALAVYMPLGTVPAKWAALLWCVAQFGAVVGASALLWREYAPGRPAWGALAAALPFVGTWWVVTYGQNTGFLLLGLAGFLHFVRRDRPLAAGACAALTALKPHLLAAFGVLLIADALSRRGRRALAAGTGAVAAALVVALVPNPDVLEQFVTAARNPRPETVPLSGYALPVPAYWLRVWVSRESFWVQFVPCAVACAALLARRLRQGAAWDWGHELPLVVAVSVLATPYGGWIFDLPVLLVPAVWALARLVRTGHRTGAVVFVAGQAVITAVTFATAGALHAYWWVAPTALALCLLPFWPGRVRRMSPH